MNSLFIFLVTVFAGLFFDRANIFLYCIVFSLLHEAGHIAAFCLCYKKRPKISISIFGIRMENNVIEHKYGCVILFSGPLVNLIFAICTYFMICDKATFQLYIVFFVNRIIFFVNILPVYYLDGGQILYRISLFYQRNYIKISNLTIISTSVMLMCFTDSWWRILLCCGYFIYNLLNDI